MKILIITLTLLSVFTSEASQMPIVRGAQLDQMKVAKAHFSHINVDSASIAVDHTSRMIRLSVSGILKHIPESCNRPNGPQCQFFGQDEVELNYKKDVTTLCTRTITAERDARPVDGIKQTIVVTEFKPARNARCMKRLPTTVTYKTEGVSRMTGEAYSSKSTFSGPALERVLVAVPVEGPFIP